MHFPKWVYHKTKLPIIVHSEEVFKSIGDEWSEKPFCEGEFPAELLDPKNQAASELVPELKKRGRPAKAKE